MPHRWVTCGLTLSGAQGRPRPAVPVDAIPAILGAAERVPFIAFGEEHGSRETHEFLRTLIADPRFARAGIDLVVEFGNALYQDVLDRYVAGADVEEASLQRVWNYTTVGKGLWGAIDIYPRLFRVAREVNASLPANQRFRVLGGDPPVDWEVRDDPRTPRAHTTMPCCILVPPHR